jgi:hypothetical protein
MTVRPWMQALQRDFFVLSMSVSVMVMGWRRNLHTEQTNPYSSGILVMTGAHGTRERGKEKREYTGTTVMEIFGSAFG